MRLKTVEKNVQMLVDNTVRNEKRRAKQALGKAWRPHFRFISCHFFLFASGSLLVPLMMAWPRNCSEGAATLTKSGLGICVGLLLPMRGQCRSKLVPAAFHESDKSIF